jgi:hypothetical protein
VDRQPELLTLQRLERRRGETWQGLWLAPLLTIVAQGFLLIVLTDEGVGWLARAAVLAAALAANLAALWSVLRAHAREVQYSEAIDAELAATAIGDYADVRAAALPRPRRRRPSAPAAEAPPEEGAGAEADEAETTVAAADPEEPPSAEAGAQLEDETSVLDATPPSSRSGSADAEPREGWVARWDRHLTWWAAGETHTKSYMAWCGALAVFMLADVAVYLATV